MVSAVITAGGKGTRLQSIANNIPKPMVPICGKPILQYQIENLKKNGITNIYIVIGYLGNVIKSYFKDGSDYGVKISYIEETEPLGSAGALFYLKESINDNFVFVYGDLIFDICFEKMIDFHCKKKSNITLFSHPNSHPFDSDLLVTNEDDVVLEIDSKHNVRDYWYHNLVNAGVFIVSSKILSKYFSTIKKTDFEKDVIKEEIKEGSVYSYKSTEYVKDSGTPDRFASVTSDVKNGIVAERNLSNLQKCIFIDRDGTINKLKGFIKNIDDVEIEDGIIDGLRYINKSGYLVIVITNQPVVARGEATFEELDCIHKKIETLLGNSGVYFDDLFYCPHHPDSGFDGEIKELKIDCNCRKPKIGLLLEAKEKYNIDFNKSFFVGDSTADGLTGKNAGAKTVLVLTGNAGKDQKYEVEFDYRINNLSEINAVIGK